MEYTITGKVITGNRLGRTLGFPTANITLGEGVNIADGVYRAGVYLDGKHYDGVANIGQRPTIEGIWPRSLEVYIFDFDKDIYGHDITVTLFDFIRTEKRFGSVEELRLQISKDIENVKKIIK